MLRSWRRLASLASPRRRRSARWWLVLRWLLYGAPTPVQELITHFQRESLSAYNAELETNLAYPYKTAPMAAAGGPVEFEDLPAEDIYMSNVSALRGAIEPIYATRSNIHMDSIYSSVSDVPYSMAANGARSTSKTCRATSVRTISFSACSGSRSSCTSRWPAALPRTSARRRPVTTTSSAAACWIRRARWTCVAITAIARNLTCPLQGIKREVNKEKAREDHTYMLSDSAGTAQQQQQQPLPPTPIPQASAAPPLPAERDRSVSAHRRRLC